jgi:hypothetical protein
MLCWLAPRGFPNRGGLIQVGAEDSHHASSGEIARGLFGRGALGVARRSKTVNQSWRLLSLAAGRVSKIEDRRPRSAGFAATLIDFNFSDRFAPRPFDWNQIDPGSACARDQQAAVQARHVIRPRERVGRSKRPPPHSRLRHDARTSPCRIRRCQNHHEHAYR